MPKSLVPIILLLLTLASSLFLVFRVTSFSGRAAGSGSSSTSLDNSYLFASPLQARAKSLQKVRVTVFLLDGRGLGVPGLPVDLEVPSSLNLIETQKITDDSGRAVFDLTSDSPGKFTVSARVGSRPISQKLTLVFY